MDWYNSNTPEGINGIPLKDAVDYDYYSFYKNGEYKDHKGGHFPDTYKTPLHETFSNESLYSVPENPGGSWKKNKFIPAIKANGGSIRQLPGGVAIEEGQGVESLHGNTHSEGGIRVSPNAEAQDQEKMLDQNYILTDEPGSNLDGKTMSISKRFDKDSNAISSRTDGKAKEAAIEYLKKNAMEKNEAYLAVVNANKMARLQKATNRFMKKYGGEIKKYYPGGSGDFSGSNNQGINDEKSRMFQRSPEGSPSPLDAMYNNLGNNTPNTSQNASNGSNFDLNGTLGDIGTAAPLIYNLGRGLFEKPEKLNANNYSVPNVNANLIPENTGESEIRDSYSRGLYDMKNSGVYSKLGQVNLSAQRAKNNSERRLQLAGVNAGIKNQTAQTNTGINQYNAQNRFRTDDYNAQNRAAKNDFLGTAATQASDLIQNNRNNQMGLGALDAMYSNPQFQNYLNSVGYKRRTRKSK